MTSFGFAGISVLLGMIAQDPAPGIDRELAEARSQRIGNVAYRLFFDLQEGSDEVRGEVTITFELPPGDPTEPVVLDFGGHDLTEVRVNGAKQEVPPRQVHNHVILPPLLLNEGVNRFSAEFASKVAATGTPLTKYVDASDGEEYVYTLVVPADAHRLFPCFDQPDLKGTFRVRLTMPTKWVAVGNGESTDLEDFPRRTAENRTQYVFEEQRPISTYLFAFAAGPFEVIEDALAGGVGTDPDRPMRMLVRRSEVGRLERHRLFEMHRASMAWLTRYFGTPYPFGKFDFVLVPGFPYGGMEHAGATFYRESALVFDHEPTESELLRRSTLIYHEVAHQWFGNLVTMRWFDDLWLKEGFATFMGYTVLEALEPGKNAWLRFHQRVKPRAYAIDATRGTTPVYQRLQNLADAKSAYGAIVYNKAPAVLRELQDRLGPAAFQRGVQRFLETHAYSNARWEELVDAFETASKRDASLWSSRWILSAGMPKVRAEWAVEGDELRGLAVTQSSVQGGDGTWPLTLDVLLLGADGSQRKHRVQLSGERVEIAELAGSAAPAAVLLNPTDVAYGLFLLDERSRDYLLEHLPRIDDLLLRAVALSALDNTVREAECDPEHWAELLSTLISDESDPETHAWLLSRLGVTLRRYLGAEQAKPRFARIGKQLVADLATGLPGRELQSFRFLATNCSDQHVLGMLRNLLDGSLRVPGLTLGTRDRFLAATALLAAGDAGAVVREQRRNAGEDIAKDVYVASAAAADAATKRRYFEGYLNPDEPPEQWMQESLSRFHWIGQSALSLPYLRKALDAVEWVKQHRKIFFMPAWIDAFVNGHSSSEALDIVRSFLAERDGLSEDLRNKILQSADELERAVRIRAEWGG